MGLFPAIPAQRTVGSGPAGGLRPTAEQTAVMDAVRAGLDVVVQARAGTGKTATLALAAQEVPRARCLYLAYNKAIALDARKRFPRNVSCRTLHSLAFAHAADWMRDRLAMPRQNGRMVAQLLRITQPLVIRQGAYDMPVDVRLTPHHLGRLAIETVRRFCYSADEVLDWWHVPRQQGFTDAAHQAFARYLLPWARAAWEDVLTPGGFLRYDHDFYLKVWAMGRPLLPFDLVALDEAQDSNRLTSRLIADQTGCQTVLVGDSEQAIYGWRGATNAMREFPEHTELFLTRSWRFGPAIAELANVFLRIREAFPLVTGNPALASRLVRDIDAPDGVLCRTNAGAMEEVIGYLDAGRPVYLQGGGDGIKRMAEAALELTFGNGTNNPELAAFSSWSEVVEYVEQDPGGSDLRAFVRLVEEHGATTIVAACERLVNAPAYERDKPGGRAAALPAGTVVVSTLHRAKGLEWGRVRIGEDVAGPRVDGETWDVRVDPGEMMLNYVGATRARDVLAPGALAAWADAERDLVAAGR